MSTFAQPADVAPIVRALLKFGQAAKREGRAGVELFCFSRAAALMPDNPAVARKLAQLEASKVADPQKAQPGATHPPTMERLKALQQELPAAMELYDSSGCKHIKHVLKRLYYSR